MKILAAFLMITSICACGTGESAPSVNQALMCISLKSWAPGSAPIGIAAINGSGNGGYYVFHMTSITTTDYSYFLDTSMVPNAQKSIPDGQVSFAPYCTVTMASGKVTNVQ